MADKQPTVTVICPRHGEHEHIIESTIPGHEGVWCLICWFDAMGPSLPFRVVMTTERAKERKAHEN